MANKAHLAVLKQGVEAWNKWRLENRSIKVDLSDVSLRDISLSGANLVGANLSTSNLAEVNLSGAHLAQSDLLGVCLFKACLSDTDLSDTYLYGSNIEEANLTRASLRNANLIHASLKNATLFEANLSKANLTRANLSKANLSKANLGEAIFNEARLDKAKLREANLTLAQLVGTNFQQADLTGCQIYGISAWDLKLEGTIQNSLVITPPHEPRITVDDLEVAQFIYLLLNHQKIRNAINSVTERGVLILGRFRDGGLEFLRAIADFLRKEKYLPIIFDFERPDDRNYTETVKTLVGLSRFVIVDLSGPSVPQELYATVPHFKVPFIPIVEKARKKEVYAMFTDMLEHEYVLKPIEYLNRENLLELIPSRGIIPAEKKLKKRRNRLNKASKK